MRRTIGFLCSIFLLGNSVFANEIEDNSLLNAVVQPQPSTQSFTLNTFQSCEDISHTLGEYYREYGNVNAGKWWVVDDMMYLEESAVPDAISQDAAAKVTNEASGMGGENDVSQTNIQVAGVDEADSIKTDEKNIYYFNQDKTAVYIATMDDTPKILKKINIPEEWYSVELYVANDTLTIISTAYGETTSRALSSELRYYGGTSFTYSIVYDVANPTEPELLRLYKNEWSYTDSRRIGDYVYVISQNSFHYPYWNIPLEDRPELKASDVLPKKLDIHYDTQDANLKIDGTSYPYHASSGMAVDCDEVTYSLPDSESIKYMWFHPSYTIVSALNLADAAEPVSTHVVVWNNSELHMSEKNLYLTEGKWSSTSFPCPADALCAMPMIAGGQQNTIIHKLNIDGANMQYQTSALIPWSPLTQYSMDEYENNFRIITSQWQKTPSTGLYILDNSLKKLSALENLAPWETFQSSRFIGDRLYLVTFEQVDPLFVIDVADSHNPNILGELKIPGYSTYLHPYDETHIIGIGYNTRENQYGNIETAGIKIDLYEIDESRTCESSNLSKEESEKCENGEYKWIIAKQLHTKTLGGRWSYSEALNNPRMFVWNSSRNMMLLPATLEDRDNRYRLTSYYNWLFWVSIDVSSGISLVGQATHIDPTGLEEKREKECNKYTWNKESKEPICRELLNGETFCEEPRDYEYIPNYCYADSSVWEYIGEHQWEYRNMQIQRSLYRWETVFGISDSMIGTYDWNLDEKGHTPFQ